MKWTINKMVVVSPGREKILETAQGNNGVISPDQFENAAGELTLQERHYHKRTDYLHETILQKALCVICPSSWNVLTYRWNNSTSIIMTGSGTKDFENIVNEKLRWIHVDVSHWILWEMYGVTAEYRWPLYVFHTRVVMTQVQWKVISLVAQHTGTAWENPKTAFERVSPLDKNMILWIAQEIQKRKT